MPLKELLAELDKLTPAELGRVQGRLNAMRGYGGVKGATADAALTSPELFVLAVLADYARKAAIGFEGLNRLRAASNFQAFREKVPGLMEMIDRQKINQNEKRVLLMYGFEMLHDNMTNIGIAVDTRSLMNHIHRMPAVFDAHFPGYARSGMLGLIVKRRVTNVNEDTD